MKFSISCKLARKLFCTAVFLSATFNLCRAATGPAETAHPVDFWRSIAIHGYAVPENDSADTLSNELSAMLASPDPALRDDLAYSILARWIARPNILSSKQLIALTDEWRANLNTGIGESGNDLVVKRSFSALCLASLAEREAKTPFMGANRYHQLVAEASNYLQAEKDLRGYDPRLGWVHATAHAGDLLQGLAHSTQMSKDEEVAILAAIAHRLSTAPQIYIQGEQDRLAAAVDALLRRPDFEPENFNQWLTRLQGEDRDVWGKPLTPETLAVYQNHCYMLQALAVHLSLAPESPSVTSYKQSVLAILRNR